MEILPKGAPMLELADQKKKKIRAAMINMFKKLKEAIFQKLKENIRNFSSGPVGKTSHFHCRGAGFNP